MIKVALSGAGIAARELGLSLPQTANAAQLMQACAANEVAKATEFTAHRGAAAANS